MGPLLRILRPRHSGIRAHRDAQQRQQVGPAVGVEDGGVEVVVELAQDGDQALFVDHAFLGGEGFAAAEFVQHVVHAGQGEAWVLGLLAFAVGV